MRRGPTRRELLTGVVVAAGGALAAGASRAQQAGAAAQAAEAAAAAAPAGPAGGRLGIRRVIWSVPTAQGRVGLTFDDGPTSRYTPQVLEMLRTARATATFNVVGLRALQEPSLLREIVAAGHELGNHTHHHDDLSLLPAARVHAEIRTAQEAIEQCVQVPVTLFRPPRGELTGVAAREAAALGMDVLMWTVSRDVRHVGTATSVAAGLTAHVEAGDVIALHDGLGHAGFDADSSMASLLRRRRDVEMLALPHVLARLLDRGLRCVAVRDLLG